jgi:hypothetical protein
MFPSLITQEKKLRGTRSCQFALGEHLHQTASRRRLRRGVSEIAVATQEVPGLPSSGLKGANPEPIPRTVCRSQSFTAPPGFSQNQARNKGTLSRWRRKVPGVDGRGRLSYSSYDAKCYHFARISARRGSTELAAALPPDAVSRDGGWEAKMKANAGHTGFLPGRLDFF